MKKQTVFKILVGSLLGLGLVSLALGQGSVSIMQKLVDLEQKLGQLESQQKKEIGDLQKRLAALNTGGTAVGLQDSLLALQGEVAQIESELAQIKESPTNSGEADKIRAATEELRQVITELRLAATQVDVPETPPKPEPPAVKAPEAEVVTSKFKIKFSGFIKMEAIYDNTEVATGDWLLYAFTGNSPQSKRQVYTMNARHSRIGLKIEGPKVGEKGQINGFIEADFAGGFPNSSTAARQALLRIRSAWAEIVYPQWEARFGQDWALIASPFPNTTSFLVGAGLGNLWMAFPQMCFTYKHNPVKAAVSINRPMSGNMKYDSYASGDFDPVQDAERTGMPWIMARVWLKTKPVTFSISGHYGQEDIADKALPIAGIHEKDTYSANADVIVTVGKAALTARGFYGENLNSFFGGVFQGYSQPDSFSVTNVKSMGGWGQVVYNLTDAWALTAGGGTDNPNDKDLINGATTKSRNSWVFGNVAFNVKKALVFMLEGEWMKTVYLSALDGENIRVQFATYYKF